MDFNGFYKKLVKFVKSLFYNYLNRDLIAFTGFSDYDSTYSSIHDGDLSDLVDLDDLRDFSKSHFTHTQQNFKNAQDNHSLKMVLSKNTFSECADLDWDSDCI